MKQDLELASFRLNPVVAVQCSGAVLVLKAPSSEQLILTGILTAVQRRRYRREFS